jgi:hypothetical protein
MLFTGSNAMFSEVTFFDDHTTLFAGLAAATDALDFHT